MKGDNAGWVEDIDFSFLLSPSMCSPPCWWFNVLTFSHFFFLLSILLFLIHLSVFVSVSLPALYSPYFTLCISHSTHTHIIYLFCSFSDPGAVVETHSAVPYAVIGGVLALLVFTVICVLIVTIWCSVRQKGNTQKFLSQAMGNILAILYHIFHRHIFLFHFLE